MKNKFFNRVKIYYNSFQNREFLYNNFNSRIGGGKPSRGKGFRFYTLNFFKFNLFKFDLDFKKKFAITLSEVLITILVIGIVAVLALHNLYQKQQERELLNQFKVNYSLLQQAYTSIQAEYGDFNNWNTTDEIYELFTSRLKVVETCYKKNGCFPNVTYKNLHPKEKNCGPVKPYSAKYPKVRLMNGASVGFNMKLGGNIMIDVNGDKGPNRFGYDTFALGFSNIYPGKIVGPSAVSDESWMYNSGLKFCSISAHDCNDMYSGYSCSHWVIRHGNMDYLHKGIPTAQWRKLFKVYKYWG